MSLEQQHSRFKLFIGRPTEDNPLGGLADEVSSFVQSAGVAPKSIGAEYLEAKKSLVLSLGYRDDEPGYRVHLHCVRLAGTTDFGADDFAALEAQMAEASQGLRGIICHELFVTDEGRFYMVFMMRSEPTN